MRFGDPATDAIGTDNLAPVWFSKTIVGGAVLGFYALILTAPPPTVRTVRGGGAMELLRCKRRTGNDHPFWPNKIGHFREASYGRRIRVPEIAFLRPKGAAAVVSVANLLAGGFLGHWPLADEAPLEIKAGMAAAGTECFAVIINRLFELASTMRISAVVT